MQIQLRSLSFNFISLSPLWGLVRLYCFCLMHLRLLKYDRVFTTYRWVFRKPAKGDLNGCFHTWFLCKATPVNKKNARFKASGADVKRSATSWLGIHASHSRLWVSVLKPTLNRHASQLVSPFLFCLRIISSAIANGMKFGSCRSPCWPGESRTRSTDRWNASKCHKPWPISCALREIEVDSSRKLPISLCSTERDGVFLHFWPLMPPPLYVIELHRVGDVQCMRSLTRPKKCRVMAANFESSLKVIGHVATTMAVVKLFVIRFCCWGKYRTDSSLIHSNAELSD